MKSKVRKKKGLMIKLREAKIVRLRTRADLESSRGSASLQMRGARMNVNEAKKRYVEGDEKGRGSGVEWAEKSLEDVKKRAAGKDTEGLQLRQVIKENRRISVIKRHFKSE